MRFHLHTKPHCHINNRTASLHQNIPQDWKRSSTQKISSIPAQFLHPLLHDADILHTMYTYINPMHTNAGISAKKSLHLGQSGELLLSSDEFASMLSYTNIKSTYNNHWTYLQFHRVFAAATTVIRPLRQMLAVHNAADGQTWLLFVSIYYQVFCISFKF